MPTLGSIRRKSRPRAPPGSPCAQELRRTSGLALRRDRPFSGKRDSCPKPGRAPGRRKEAGIILTSSMGSQIRLRRCSRPVWTKSETVHGVTARFVQNCTLSDFGQERCANIAQGPEGGRAIAVGPDIVARQSDVLPPEGSDVREEIVGYSDALNPQMLDGAIEVEGVPVHDCGGDETEARGAEALVLERAISNLALTMKKDRTP